MVNETQKTPLQFYKNSGGNEPVRDWLKELEAPDRYAIGQDLMRAQWRWPVGMPLCRAMGHGVGNSYKPAKLPHRTRVGMFA